MKNMLQETEVTMEEIKSRSRAEALAIKAIANPSLLSVYAASLRKKLTEGTPRSCPLLPYLDTLADSQLIALTGLLARESHDHREHEVLLRIYKERLEAEKQNKIDELHPPHVKQLFSDA